MLKFFKDFKVDLLAINLLWQDVLLLSVPARILIRNVVAMVNYRSSGVVFSCGCVSWLSLKLDDLVEIIPPL